jgi:hypothetical protein
MARRGMHLAIAALAIGIAAPAPAMAIIGQEKVCNPATTTGSKAPPSTPPFINKRPWVPCAFGQGTLASVSPLSAVELRLSRRPLTPRDPVILCAYEKYHSVH